MAQSRSDSPRVETRRQTGEAIADAVAAHMLVYVTDHCHEFMRKKGTFKVSEERDCSQGIKEIVHKRYKSSLPHIEELGVCPRKLDVLDALSTRRASPNARKGQVLRLLLTLQWKLPVGHKNNPGEYKENPSEDKETYERIIVLPAKTELSQVREDNYTREWTIGVCHTIADRPISSTRVIAPSCSGLSKRDLISWQLQVDGCSRFDLGHSVSVADAGPSPSTISRLSFC
jgi:hypothetical protein